MSGVRLLVAVLLVAACGGIPKTAPTHIVELANNEFGSFLLLVFDDSGLVQAGAAADPSGPGTNATATAHPESSEITVSWTGGACSHSPKLAVKGDPTALTLELDVSPIDFSLVPQDCPAIGLFFAVRLTLGQPVEQDALTLTLLSR